MSVLEVINCGKAKDKYLQKALREIVYECATNQCQIKVKYIKSKNNSLPDMLSRYGQDRSKKKEFQELLLQQPEWERCTVRWQHIEFTHGW